MPLSFQCPRCAAAMTSFMRIGETATCQSCGSEVSVPEIARPIEGAVSPVAGSGRPGSGSQPADFGQVAIGGTILECQHCGCKGFIETSAYLPSGGRTYQGLEWLDEPARVLVCANCSFIHWFAADASAHGRQETEEQCLSCAAALASPGARCEACGWDWRREGSEAEA